MSGRDASDYVFVEVARGNPDGSFSRNKVVNYDSYQANGYPDAFSSYMLFDVSLAQHIKEQGEKGGRRSVKGYRGPALPIKIVADFDSKDNLEQARKNALHYVRRAAHKFGFPDDYFRVFFSGCKGFSIELPAEAFGGFEPHPDAAQHVGHIAKRLSGGMDFPTFDESIYDKVTRLWRTPNTPHGETGLHKIELTLDELASLSIDEIRELAREPRYDFPAHRPPIEAVRGLVELYVEAKTVAASRSDRPKESASEDGTIKEGEGRNNYLTSLAGTLRRRGLGEEEIFTSLMPLNEAKCDPPLAEREVRKIARSVAGYEAGPEPSEDPKEEKEERRNQTDRLIGYALEDLEELFVDQHGAPHALVDGEPVPLSSRSYSWLRRLMWEHEERAVNGEYLKTTAGTLAAHAEFSGEVRELHTRAAWYEGALYYELRPGRVAKVSAEGWDFEPDPPVLFRRFPNLKPLPDPERGGTIKELTGYVNLKTERDRRLFTAYAVTLPLPHVGRPILNASGAMGSGKTTIGRVVKRLLDPSAPETVRLDPRDFLQKASHAYVVMLDNQNTIPEWAADTLCRLVSGEADSKRRLYTDDEDVIIELRRAILLNGINVPTDRGDVLDRSLVVELERIPDGERKTEEELWERFEHNHPELLGALFDLLSQAIALKASLKLSRRPRLADWGEYAAAVYEVTGWKEEQYKGAELFLLDWDQNVQAQNQGTLDGSPVAQAIIKFMEDKEEEYTATASELHKKLEAVAEEIGVSLVRDKAWPKSARWLWRRINEVLPLLVTVGIEATRDRDENGTTITLRRLPKNDASDVSHNDNGSGKPKTACNTSGDDASSNASDAPNASSNASQKADTHAASGNTGNSDIRNTAFSEEPLGGLSVESVLAEFKGDTPSRRLLDRYLDEPDEERFEYLAKTVIYTLAKLPPSERDKDLWRKYAPVVRKALEKWAAA